MTSQHCTECNYHLEGYADHETVCGACLDMATQTTVTEELSAAYRLLETALHRLDALDGAGRSGYGRKLDQVRWLLGDLIADMTPTTEPADIDGAEAFTTAAERGQ
jgi:hypothetical protein